MVVHISQEAGPHKLGCESGLAGTLYSPAEPASLYNVGAERRFPRVGRVQCSTIIIVLSSVVN